MRSIYSVFLFFFLISSHPANADTQKLIIVIRGESIIVPALAGFHEAGDLSPQLKKKVESFTPASNHLLGVFISESDLGRVLKDESPELRRYMLVEVQKEEEAGNIGDITDTEFGQVVNQLKQNQGVFLRETQSTMDSLAEVMAKDHNVQLRFEKGEQVLLGIFLERSNAVSFAFFLKYHRVIGQKQYGQLVAGGSSIVKVKGKVFFLYVYSTYDSPSDLEWVRASSSMWVDAVMKSNEALMSIDRPGIQGTDVSGASLEKVADLTKEKIRAKRLQWLIIGIIVAALVGITQIVKKLFAASHHNQQK